MIRISFRQGMALGFAIIVLFLGGATLQSWLIVERLVAQSRQGNEEAIQVTAAIQELAERTVDIERSARQYLLLDDPVFRQRFDEHLMQSLMLVERLNGLAEEPMLPLLSGWRMVGEGLRSGLDSGLGRGELTPLMARLVELNGLLKQSSQRWIEAQNSRLLAELEASRLRLGGQIMLALAGALMVALAIGWWLVRPVRQLEIAISRLGASRFDETVAVGGPADLRQLGFRLDWLRQRLARLESDRDRSLRHISHELKTPLTALKEGTALLREEVPGPLADGQREVVDILQHNVASLQQQIESLLSLNAAAFEARTLKSDRVDLKGLLNNVIQRRELHSQSRHLTVIAEVPEGANAVLDEEKMSVVLDNLLSNAIDFSPMAGKIRLIARPADNGWQFECIDQGPGVAEAEQALVFDPFVQGSRPAPMARNGSGVGLSIVRELVRAMGGTASIRPSPTGAHFVVELPNET